MGQKPSIAERLGLVQRVDPIPTPAADPSIDLGITETAQVPEVPVDAALISGDDVVQSVYAQGAFSEETSLYRIQRFIESLPNEMPTATKQMSIAGILAASNINIHSLITDGEGRKAILMSAEANLKAEHEQRRAERTQHIEDFRQAIQEAERQMSEDKAKTDQSCDAIEKELEAIESLLKFAEGVANANNGGGK